LIKKKKLFWVEKWQKKYNRLEHKYYFIIYILLVLQVHIHIRSAWGPTPATASNDFLRDAYCSPSPKQGYLPNKSQNQPIRLPGLILRLSSGQAARGMLRVDTERRFLPRFKNRGLAPSNVSIGK
jgi:hypothetical protein